MNNTKKLSGNFVLLSTESTKILVSQADVGQAYYLDKANEWRSHEQHDGIFFSNQITDKWFIAISDDLKPTNTMFDDRFIVLPFIDKNSDLADINSSKSDSQKILWTWKSVQVLINKEFEFYELPNYALKQNSPVDSYTVYENDVVFFCDTTKLVDYALGEINI